MKKLMVAACAIAFAAVTQASQFSWSYDAYGEFEEGATVYVFSGVDTLGATLAGILTTQGIDEFNTAIAEINYGTKTLNEFGKATGFTVGGTADYATVFVFKDGVTGGKDFAYYAGVEAADYIYTPPAGATTLEIWGDDPYNTGTIKGSTPGPTPVPEPTTGLLVLLGMAGLALKRKLA